MDIYTASSSAGGGHATIPSTVPSIRRKYCPQQSEVGIFQCEPNLLLEPPGSRYLWSIFFLVSFHLQWFLTEGICQGWWALRRGEERGPKMQTKNKLGLFQKTHKHTHGWAGIPNNKTDKQKAKNKQTWQDTPKTRTWTDQLAIRCDGEIWQWVNHNREFKRRGGW